MLKLTALCLVVAHVVGELESLHYYERDESVRMGMLGTRLDGNSFSREGRDHQVLEMEEEEAADFLASAPESFDARTKWTQCARTIGFIKDQAACGSCWAVSSSSVMQDRMCIHEGSGVPASGKEPTNENNVVKLINEPIADWEISAEDLMSCCPYCGQGCKGGFIVDAMKYWQQFGVPSGGYYGSYCGCKPYKINPLLKTMQQTPACTKSCDTPNYPLEMAAARFRASKYYGLRGEAAMMKEIMTNGPIACGFTVHRSFENFFKTPTKAVYSGPDSFWKRIFDPKLGGHAVRCIGWGVDEKGTPYWEFANSWNTTWNGDGTFRYLRGKNLYGMESQCAAGMPAMDNPNGKRIRCAKRDFPYNA